MNCEQVIPLLSAFHDGELPSAQRAPVAEHVSSCGDCARRLESLQRLSALVQRSPTPPTPKGLLERVERVIGDNNAIANRPPFSYRRRVVAALLATAAAFIGIGVWQFAWGPGHDHQEMAATYGRFLDAYAAGAKDAPQILVSRYHGQPIDVQNAAHVLKRDSVARPTLLAKHEVADRFLLRMPDCDCVGTVYSCEGQTSLVLFEHEQEHPEWFGKRPMTRTECAGKPCCLVELNGSLVATWKVNGGYVTAVGVRDVAQLEQLMGELASS